jgi:hypothetical protein
MNSTDTPQQLVKYNTMTDRSPHRPITLFGNTSNTTESSPNIPVITQTQEESPDNVQYSSTATPTSHPSIRQNDPLEYLCDVALGAQTPAFSPAPFRPSLSPKVSSPDVSHVKATTNRNKKQSSKRTAMRELVTSIKKKNKKTFSPESSMLYFLRSEYVDSYVTLHSKLKNGFNTSHQMKQALNNWAWNGKDITWGCFKNFESLMMSSHYPITQDHTRLMLEDFMMCEPGDHLLCLISQKHHFFTGRGSITWIKNMTESIEIESWKPIRFQKEVFFAVVMTVKSNVHLNDFRTDSKSKTMEEIRYLCSKEGGAGLSLSLPNNSTQLIKFYDVLHHCQFIQFWSTVTQSKRMTIVKKAMRNIRDTARLGPVVARYLDEVYGDRFVTAAYLQTYELLMAKALSAKQLDAYKAEPISTERLTRHLNLSDKDPKFIEFRNHIDTVTKNAILEVYGNFSEFTTPILTQHTLSEFAELFKTTLPQHYTTLSLLLNKQVSTLFFKSIMLLQNSILTCVIRIKLPA